MPKAAYMDHNATTPVCAAAYSAALGAMSACGNPSSVHACGRAARRILDDARESLAALTGARPENVIFTSGGTEANNQALLGHGSVCASAVEHASVLNARPDARIIPVDGDGVVGLDALRALLGGRDRPDMISIMLANNETGAIQPVAEAAEIAKSFGVLVHCDAIQAVGRIPVDMTALGVDALTVSAHKMGGLPGSGALIVADGFEPRTLINGASQERGRRSGTENLPGVAALGAAAATADLDAFAALAPLRDRFEDELKARAPEARILSADAKRLANTSCFAAPGLPADTQVMALDLAGVAVSAGSACASGAAGASRALAAMGVPDDIARCAVRVSLGPGSDESAIELYFQAWDELRTRAQAA